MMFPAEFYWVKREEARLKVSTLPVSYSEYKKEGVGCPVENLVSTRP